MSDIIKKATSSEFSHVAMALWTTLPFEYEPRLFVVESTTLNDVPDISGEFKRGVQIIALSQKLDGYNGQAWLFPLKEDINAERKQKMISWLFSRYTSKVDYDTIGAVQAGLDPRKFWQKIWPFSLLVAKPDFNKLFCSELVAKALQVAEVIPPSINPSEETPEDIANYPCFKEKVRIL